MKDSTPPAPPSRLIGLDLARFLAFVGMVIVNFKIVMGAAPDGSWASGLSGALEGRAAAAFVVLAGIGLGMAGQQSQGRTLLVTLRRGLFLLAIGLLNMLIFEADILHYYAFYFFFGVLLLPLSSRALMLCILALNLGFVGLILTLDYDTGWNWVDLSYAGFWTPSGFIRNLFFNGWHPVLPWFGFLLFGVVLSRLPMADRRLQGLLLGVGAAALAAAEGISAALQGALGPELAQLATTDPIPPMPLYTLAGMGAAAVLIGAAMLASGRLQQLGLLQWVLPAGRQTLTLYIAHILIGMGTLEALGLLGGQSPGAALLAALIFCAAAALYAALWSLVFKRGPVEAAMRALAG